MIACLSFMRRGIRNQMKRLLFIQSLLFLEVFTVKCDAGIDYGRL